MWITVKYDRGTPDRRRIAFEPTVLSEEPLELPAILDELDEAMQIGGYIVVPVYRDIEAGTIDLLYIKPENVSSITLEL